MMALTLSVGLMALTLSVGLMALTLSVGLMKQALLLLMNESLAVSMSRLQTRITDNYCLKLSGINHALRQCLLLLYM